jgi:hypothetical protein
MTSKIIAILLLISAVSATGNPRLFDASWRAAITPEATFVRPTPRTGETHGINQGIKLYTHMPNKHYAFVDYAPLGTNSLVGWWRGEDNAEDDSSYGHDGTWGGTAAYTDGRFGRAFDLDGSSYIDTGSETIGDGLFAESNRSWTVSAWANFAADGAVVARASGTEATRTFYFLRGSGVLQIYLRG